MAEVRLRGVDKAFGPVMAVNGIDLDIAHGEFVVFVGPSGCGKSTLLRMIAGLEEITAGELHIDGLLCNDVAPRDRGIAMVFQSYALYPHMTVHENMGFPLRFVKMSRAERDAKIREAARILQMEDLLERKPAQLSGGQRQRVAIGRSIVRHPKVFLFDEPLSNLDAALRVDMRMEIARLHQELDATMIYVTHDQIEAMTLADKIVVLDKGVVQQVGAPLELYHDPQNLFVAGFIGSPKMNLLPVTGTNGDGAKLDVGSQSIRSMGFEPLTGRVSGGDMTLGVRPQSIMLTDPSDTPMPAKARIVEHLGDETVINVELKGGETALVVVPGDAKVSPGETLGLTFDPADALLFSSSGQRVATVRHA